MGELVDLFAFEVTRNPELPPIIDNRSQVDFPEWVKPPTACVWVPRTWLLETPHGVVPVHPRISVPNHIRNMRGLSEPSYNDTY